MKKIFFGLMACFVLLLVPAFVFAGCGKSSSGGEKKKQDEDTTIRYTVTFVWDGGQSTSKVDAGKKVKRPDDPDEIGYDFDAWYTTDEYVTMYNFNTPVNSDITLYGALYDNKVNMQEMSTYSCASGCDYGAVEIVVPSFYHGKPVTEMGNGSSGFGTPNLKDVLMPNTITRISAWAFANSNLTHITLPESLNSIGLYAFANCYHLALIVNNSELEIAVGGEYGDIGYYAIGVFNKGETVTAEIVEEDDGFICYVENDFKAIIGYVGEEKNIVISDNIDMIKSYCFFDYIYLQSLTLPEGLSAIGEYAFCHSSNGISEIAIPESVEYIGYSAFENCGTINTVSLKLVSNETFSHIFGSNTSISEVLVLGGNVKNSEFEYRGDITSINLPEDITSIGNDAFYGCTHLATITIPESVESIGRSAFANCRALKDVVIPVGVSEIGEGAFDWCYGLESVTLSFVFDTKVRDFISLDDSVCHVSIIVRDGTYMHQEEFADMQSLVSVVFECDMYEISAYAFRNCNYLTSVTFGNVQVIGQYAFESCSGLTTIAIPESVTNIGNGAFDDCGALETVIIDSQTIYSGLTSGASYGKLLFYATTVKVDKNIDGGSNAYLNNNFTKDTTSDLVYNIYTKD